VLLPENQGRHGRHGLMAVTDGNREGTDAHKLLKKTEMRKMSIQKQLAEMKSTSSDELGMNYKDC